MIGLALFALRARLDLVSLARALPIAALCGLTIFFCRKAPRAAAAALAFAALDALLLALAPPTEWDVLAYHLALPKLYLAAGRVYEIPWLAHSHYPHLMELLYAPALALDERIPALLHAAACAGWVWAVFAAARKRLGEAAAWLAAALCAAQPAVLRFAGVAHSDGALALFHWLSCAALWDWTEKPRARALLLAGLFSGLGASCKISGLVFAAPLAAFVLLRRPRKPDWRSFAAFALPAALVVSPWLLKDWLWAGDPVWPFLPGLFGGKWGGPEVARALVSSAASPAPLGNLLRSAPPLAWAALASVFLAKRRRVPGWLFLPGATAFALLWRDGEVWRYLWPAYPALALAAADALGVWSLAAAVAVLSAPCGNAAFGALAARPSSGQADRRAAYLSRALDHYDFYRDVNASLAGKAANVLLFREIRGYYLDVPYMWGDPANQGLIRYGALDGPDALLARLRELGVTHVLVNETLGIYAPGATYYDARTVALMDAALARCAPVLRRGGLSLYRLPR